MNSVLGYKIKLLNNKKYGSSFLHNSSINSALKTKSSSRSFIIVLSKYFNNPITTNTVDVGILRSLLMDARIRVASTLYLQDSYRYRSFLKSDITSKQVYSNMFGSTELLYKLGYFSTSSMKYRYTPFFYKNYLNKILFSENTSTIYKYSRGTKNIMSEDVGIHSLIRDKLDLNQLSSFGNDVFGSSLFLIYLSGSLNKKYVHKNVYSSYLDKPVLLWDLINSRSSLSIFENITTFYTANKYKSLFTYRSSSYLVNKLDNFSSTSHILHGLNRNLFKSINIPRKTRINSISILYSRDLIFNLLSFNRSNFISSSESSLVNSSKKYQNSWSSLVWNRSFNSFVWKKLPLFSSWKFRALSSLYSKSFYKDLGITLSDKNIYGLYVKYITNENAFLTIKNKKKFLNSLGSSIYSTNGWTKGSLELVNSSKSIKSGKGSLNYLFLNTSLLFSAFNSSLIKSGKRRFSTNLIQNIFSNLLLINFGKDPKLFFIRLLSLLCVYVKHVSVKSRSGLGLSYVGYLDTKKVFITSIKFLMNSLRSDKSYSSSRLLEQFSSFLGFSINRSNLSVSRRSFSLGLKITLKLLSFINEDDFSKLVDLRVSNLKKSYHLSLNQKESSDLVLDNYGYYTDIISNTKYQDENWSSKGFFIKNSFLGHKSLVIDKLSEEVDYLVKDISNLDASSDQYIYLDKMFYHSFKKLVNSLYFSCRILSNGFQNNHFNLMLLQYYSLVIWKLSINSSIYKRNRVIKDFLFSFHPNLKISSSNNLDYKRKYIRYLITSKIKSI